MRDHNYIFINGLIICFLLLVPSIISNANVNLNTSNENLNLKFFLDTNNVNENTYYNGYYDCREFSTDLINDLRDANFRCGYAMIRPKPEQRKTIGEFNENKSSLHRIVWVEINKEIIFVEPQTDKIYKMSELGSHYNKKSKNKYVDVVIDGYHSYYFTVPINSTYIDPSQYTEPENDSTNIVDRIT